MTKKLTMIEAPKAAHFCNLIGSSKLKGYWYGSAFQHHPKGIIRDRMIFTNKWNVNNYCSVKVITDPDAKVILGCQNPAAHGNPNPRVDKGDLVTVYQNGRWIAEGPWCERIVSILRDVEQELADIRQNEKEEAERRAEASKLAAAEKLKAAAAVFDQPQTA